MPQKRKPDQTQRIAKAALFLAEKDGWDALTPVKIAKKAKVPVSTVPDVWTVLRLVLDDLDAGTLKNADTGGERRDALFETLMARFDLMQEHRNAYTALLPALLKNPQAAPQFVKPFLNSMSGMLEASGAPSSQLHAAAFGAVYLGLAEIWKKDDTKDLSKTMAAVDKALGYLQKVVSLFPRPNQ